MLEPRLFRANVVEGVPKLGGGPPAADGVVNAPLTAVGVPAGVYVPPAKAAFDGLTDRPGPDIDPGYSVLN
jgi:hypothetical protein